MSGAFGLREDGNPYHVPPERLTDARQRLDVFELYREGLLLEGVTAILQLSPGGITAWLDGAEKGDGDSRRFGRGAGKFGEPESLHRFHSEIGRIWIDDKPIIIDAHQAFPMPVFICPACEQRKYKLFEAGGAWACRQCHGLDYASRHRWRSIPGFSRLLWLRRRLGASPLPFTPLPARPRRGLRYWRLVREIKRLEAGLIEHARRDVTNVLERRHDSRRRNRS